MTVGEIIAALDQVRQGASALVERKPDPVIAGIVAHADLRGGASLDEARTRLAEIAADSDDVRAFLDFIESGERPLQR